MGCSFSVEGIVPVQNVPEVQAIVDKFNELSNGCSADFDGESVEFSGFSMMSYGTASELEDIIKELSPYATKPSFVVTEVDDEECRVYVGSPEGEKAAISRDSLDEIENLLQYLTKDDKEKLKGML